MSNDNNPPEQSNKNQEEDETKFVRLIDQITTTLLVLVIKILSVISAIIIPLLALAIAEIIGQVTFIPELVVETPNGSYPIPVSWVVSTVAVGIIFSRLLRLMLNKWPTVVSKALVGEKHEDTENKEED